MHSGGAAIVQLGGVMKMLEMVRQGNHQGGVWDPPVDALEQVACNNISGFQGEYDRAKRRIFEPEVWPPPSLRSMAASHKK